MTLILITLIDVYTIVSYAYSVTIIAKSTLAHVDGVSISLI